MVQFSCCHAQYLITQHRQPLLQLRYSLLKSVLPVALQPPSSDIAESVNSPSLGSQLRTTAMANVTNIRPMRDLPQPIAIPIPGWATVTISGTTNAAYHQRVTVTDVTNGGQTFILRGQGEGSTPMSVDGQPPTNGSVILDAVEPSYRTLLLTCEFSSSGREDDFSLSRVVHPRTWAEYYPDGTYTPVRIFWEIDVEDGADLDYNDSIITIAAHLG
ncbi:hypothetical protein BJX68DRAFT_228845, partial [Aspergillus pseudodeflectus]